MRQITIVGLGMIGSSLGLALKQLKPAPRIIGHDSQYDAAMRAQKLKAVDKLERNPLDAVAGSDLVVIATPVGTIPQVMQTVAGELAPDCIVTDTGSTKRDIIHRAAELLPPNVAFVGGHPMTGKATGGVDGPSALIFRGATYCLTPVPNTPGHAVDAVASMIQEIGAQPYFLDPVEHDGLVAGISHLPHLVSVSLMRLLSEQPGWREMSVLAAGGFDSMTRLASQNPTMFADIITSNTDNVVRHLDLLLAKLQEMRGILQEGDSGLLKQFEEAQRQRIAWEEMKRRQQVEK